MSGHESKESILDHSLIHSFLTGLWDTSTMNLGGARQRNGTQYRRHFLVDNCAFHGELKGHGTWGTAWGLTPVLHGWSQFTSQEPRSSSMAWSPPS